MRIAGLLVIAVGLAYSFLIFGLWGTMRCTQWFIQKDVAGYCVSTFGNVGTAGVDAFVLGLLAWLVTTMLAGDIERYQFQFDLNRTRGATAQAKLGLIFSRFTNNLDLSGHAFSDESLECLALSRIRMGSRNRNSTTLRKITIADSTLKHFDAYQCRLEDVTFSRSTLRGCNFRDCQILTSRADRPFLASTNSRSLKFDGAVLTGVDLSAASMPRCSFWRVVLRDSKLPIGLFNRLEAIGAVRIANDGGWVVSPRWQIMADYRRASGRTVDGAAAAGVFSNWRLLVERAFWAVKGM